MTFGVSLAALLTTHNHLRHAAVLYRTDTDILICWVDFLRRQREMFRQIYVLPQKVTLSSNRMRCMGPYTRVMRQECDIVFVERKSQLFVFRSPLASGDHEILCEVLAGSPQPLLSDTDGAISGRKPCRRVFDSSELHLIDVKIAPNQI